MGKHYGFRSVHGRVLPCVEVTETYGNWSATMVNGKPVVSQSNVEVVPVRRLYGFTWGHAISRAMTWMRAHGDPR